MKYVNSLKCPKALMVCNKCTKRSYCTFKQVFYKYEEAENKTYGRNKSAQNRTKLSPEVVAMINDVFTPGI